MKTVLAALNAKYIHTNLAVRSIAAYAAGMGVGNIVIWERTINHRHRRLLEELAEQKADVVVFSLYIWNVEEMRRLADDLRRVQPGVILAAAGPEASCRGGEFLAANPAFDLVVAGEGEAAVTELLIRLAERGRWDGPRIIEGRPMNMDALPFPYDDWEEVDGRVLYYETMRGCPFACTYCLSSTGQGVRYRALELVLADLDRFLAAGVRQVKLVDRTFNCDRQRALAIWRHLRDHDNGTTNFHFELAGELIDDAAIGLLAGVRPGQFQFEIGVQSVNRETLAAIRRPADTERLFAAVGRLQVAGNIHLHLDLIGGLPHEDFGSFRDSFNAVYALGPEQLQVGFLKVLKGATMEAEAKGHGIVYSAAAPYEVLGTRWLTFGELARLHGLADMVELYHNSGRFTHLVAELCGSFANPFNFYDRLATHFAASGCRDAPPSKVGYYTLLGSFMEAEGITVTERRRWLCRYDMALHEKPKKWPEWVGVEEAGPLRERVLAYLGDAERAKRILPGLAVAEPKHIWRVAHFEAFPFDPRSGAEGEAVLVFDYSRRDIRGRAHTQRVDLP